MHKVPPLVELLDEKTVKNRHRWTLMWVGIANKKHKQLCDHLMSFNFTRAVSHSLDFSLLSRSFREHAKKDRQLSCKNVLFVPYCCCRCYGYTKHAWWSLHELAYFVQATPIYTHTLRQKLNYFLLWLILCEDIVSEFAEMWETFLCLWPSRIIFISRGDSQHPTLMCSEAINSLVKLPTP